MLCNIRKIYEIVPFIALKTSYYTEVFAASFPQTLSLRPPSPSTPKYCFCNSSSVVTFNHMPFCPTPRSLAPLFLSSPPSLLPFYPTP